MKRSFVNAPMFTSTSLFLIAGAFLLSVALHDNHASAQSSLPNYGKGYGFSGGVGWGQLPSTPPSRGSGYASQFRAGRTPINTYRVPTQLGFQPYGVRRYGYVPGYPVYRQPTSIYGHGVPVYGNGFVPYGVQLNAFPGGVIQTFQGPFGW